MNWFLDPIAHHYADFEGRADRAMFWKFTLGLVIISLGGVGLVWLTKTVMAALLVIFWLTILLPYSALAVRRLHDAGYTGWLVLLPLVPYVGVPALLALCALPSKPDTNQAIS